MNIAGVGLTGVIGLESEKQMLADVQDQGRAETEQKLDTASTGE